MFSKIKRTQVENVMTLLGWREARADHTHTLTLTRKEVVLLPMVEGDESAAHSSLVFMKN